MKKRLLILLVVYSLVLSTGLAQFPHSDAGEIFSESFDGISWINHAILESTFLLDVEGKCYVDTTLHIRWIVEEETGFWQIAHRLTYQYDDQWQLVHYLVESYTDELGWTNQSQNYYSYNNDGDLIHRIIESYQDGTLTTVQEHTFEYIFNGSGWLIEQYTYKWIDELPSITTRDLYTYDVNGNNLEKLYQYHDELTDTWQNAQLETNTFESNQLIQSTVYGWLAVENSWVESFNLTFSYSEGLLEQYVQLNPLGGSKKEYVYNNDGQLIEDTYSILDPEQQDWLDYGRSYYNDLCGRFSNYHTEENTIDQLKIYPNPGNSFNIINAETLGEVVSVSIYNSTGQLMYSIEDCTPTSLTFHCSRIEQLPAGPYTIMLYSDTSSSSVLWMKQ